MARSWNVLVFAALFGVLAVLCEGPCPTCIYAAEGEAGPAVEPAKAAANPQVIIETSEGAIQVELFADKAPKTVENFLQYVDAGFYDGTIFHRVIDGFMIQGGGFAPDMTEKKTRAPVENEARSDLKNLRGTVAMARKRDVHSATAQFFINVADNAFLDHSDNTVRGFGYAVFGNVTSGMDVVDRIKAARTTAFGQYEGVPETAIVIKSIKRVQPAQ